MAEVIVLSDDDLSPPKKFKEVKTSRAGQNRRHEDKKSSRSSKRTVGDAEDVLITKYFSKPKEISQRQTTSDRDSSVVEIVNGREPEKESQPHAKRSLLSSLDASQRRDGERGDSSRHKNSKHERSGGEGRADSDRERHPDRDRERLPSRNKERHPDRDRERHPDRSKERHPDRDRERHSDRDREQDKNSIWPSETNTSPHKERNKGSSGREAHSSPKGSGESRQTKLQSPTKFVHSKSHPKHSHHSSEKRHTDAGIFTKLFKAEMKNEQDKPRPGGERSKENKHKHGSHSHKNTPEEQSSRPSQSNKHSPPAKGIDSRSGRESSSRSQTPSSSRKGEISIRNCETPRSGASSPQTAVSRPKRDSPGEVAAHSTQSGQKLSRTSKEKTTSERGDKLHGHGESKNHTNSGGKEKGGSSNRPPSLKLKQQPEAIPKSCSSESKRPRPDLSPIVVELGRGFPPSQHFKNLDESPPKKRTKVELNSGSQSNDSLAAVNDRLSPQSGACYGGSPARLTAPVIDLASPSSRNPLTVADESSMQIKCAELAPVCNGVIREGSGGEKPIEMCANNGTEPKIVTALGEKVDTVEGSEKNVGEIERRGEKSNELKANTEVVKAERMGENVDSDASGKITLKKCGSSDVLEVIANQPEKNESNNKKSKAKEKSNKNGKGDVMVVSDNVNSIRRAEKARVVEAAMWDGCSAEPQDCGQAQLETLCGTLAPLLAAGEQRILLKLRRRHAAVRALCAAAAARRQHLRGVTQHCADRVRAEPHRCFTVLRSFLEQLDQMKLVATAARPLPSGGSRVACSTADGDVAATAPVVDDASPKCILREASASGRRIPLVTCSASSTAAAGPAAAPAAAAGADDETTRRRHRRHVTKLARTLRLLEREIAQHEQREVDWEDESGSAYMVGARLKRRYVQVYQKYCEVVGAEEEASRLEARRIRFEGTKYPSINRRIEKFVNRTREFPDFKDVYDLIEAANRKDGLRMGATAVHEQAKAAFARLGEQLQRRRRAALVESMDALAGADEWRRQDPADLDATLHTELAANAQRGRAQLSQVFQQFVEKQEAVQAERRERRRCADDGGDEPESAADEDEESEVTDEGEMDLPVSAAPASDASDAENWAEEQGTGESPDRRTVAPSGQTVAGSCAAGVEPAQTSTEVGPAAEQAPCIVLV